MSEIIHLTAEQLQAGLEHICQAPKEKGLLEMIVRRPQEEQRELLSEGALDPAEGLVGDNWKQRSVSQSDDGSLDPETQITIMSSRAADLVSQDKDRWPLAGDQLYLDMDLSNENLPPGTRLSLGKATIEITAVPHNGCKRFVARFGLAAMKFVNSEIGKQLHLRGIYAKVIEPGVIRPGDMAAKISGD